MFERREIRRWPRDQLVRWALSQATKSIPAKLVLTQMASECDSPFLEVVFNNRAAGQTLNLSVKTVRRAVAELENLELISFRGTKAMDAHRYVKVWKLEFD